MPEIFEIKITAPGSCYGVHTTQANSVEEAVRNICHRQGDRNGMSKVTAVVYAEWVLNNRRYRVIDQRPADSDTIAEINRGTGVRITPGEVTADEVIKDRRAEQIKTTLEMFTPDPDEVDEGTYSDPDEYRA